MDTYADATVFFIDGLVVSVGDFVYAGEMNNLKVRLDGEWVHVQSESESGTDSFPASVIKCVAWDEHIAEAAAAP